MLSPVVRRLAARWPAAALLCVLTAGGPARADVVDIPPSCPDGATPDGCHSGPFCRPQDCSQSPTCPEGQVCKDVELCAEPFSCGGGLTTGEPGTPFDNIQGPCGEGGTCTKGTCKPFKVCVAMTATTSDSGGSSGAPTGTAASTASSSAGTGDAGSDSATGGTPMKIGCEGCRSADDDGAPALLLFAVLALAVRRRGRQRAR